MINAWQLMAVGLEVNTNRGSCCFASITIDKFEAAAACQRTTNTFITMPDIASLLLLLLLFASFFCLPCHYTSHVRMHLKRQLKWTVCVVRCTRCSLVVCADSAMAVDVLQFDSILFFHMFAWNNTISICISRSLPHCLLSVFSSFISIFFVCPLFIHSSWNIPHSPLNQCNVNMNTHTRIHNTSI